MCRRRGGAWADRNKIIKKTTGSSRVVKLAKIFSKHYDMDHSSAGSGSVPACKWLQTIFRFRLNGNARSTATRSSWYGPHFLDDTPTAFMDSARRKRVELFVLPKTSQRSTDTVRYSRAKKGPSLTFKEVPLKCSFCFAVHRLWSKDHRGNFQLLVVVSLWSVAFLFEM